MTTHHRTVFPPGWHVRYSKVRKNVAAWSVYKGVNKYREFQTEAEARAYCEQQQRCEAGYDLFLYGRKSA